MRKLVGRNSRKTDPAMAAKISNAAARSRNGEFRFRPLGDGPALKPSGADMVPPSEGFLPQHYIALPTRPFHGTRAVGARGFRVPGVAQHPRDMARCLTLAGPGTHRAHGHHRLGAREGRRPWTEQPEIRARGQYT